LDHRIAYFTISLSFQPDHGDHDGRSSATTTTTLSRRFRSVDLMS
jgi:hypothetical protein